MFGKVSSGANQAIAGFAGRRQARHVPKRRHQGHVSRPPSAQLRSPYCSCSRSLPYLFPSTRTVPCSSSFDNLVHPSRFVAGRRKRREENNVHFLAIVQTSARLPHHGQAVRHPPVPSSRPIHWSEPSCDDVRSTTYCSATYLL